LPFATFDSIGGEGYMFHRLIWALFTGFGALFFHPFLSESTLAQETAAPKRVAIRIDVTSIEDLKAVYATVESTDVIAARARIGGTVFALSADEGDFVEVGGTLATVVDDRLAPQVRALDARVTALEAQAGQAQTDLERARKLLQRGVTTQVKLDEAKTRRQVAQGQLDSVRQERGVLIQQQREGEVFAPTSGTILDVKVTAGAVVFAGEPVAYVASEDYVLRIRLPERHARHIKKGDEVVVDKSVLGRELAAIGTIHQVYPQIVDGRVIADATVEGLGAFFVGERILVWVSAGERKVILLPEEFIQNRFGVDFVKLSADEGRAVTEVVVQRGRSHNESEVEILSGLAEGDIVIAP